MDALGRQVSRVNACLFPAKWRNRGLNREKSKGTYHLCWPNKIFYHGFNNVHFLVPNLWILMCSLSRAWQNALVWVCCLTFHWFLLKFFMDSVPHSNHTEPSTFSLLSVAFSFHWGCFLLRLVSTRPNTVICHIVVLLLQCFSSPLVKGWSCFPRFPQKVICVVYYITSCWKEREWTCDQTGCKSNPDYVSLSPSLLDELLLHSG